MFNSGEHCELTMAFLSCGLAQQDQTINDIEEPGAGYATESIPYVSSTMQAENSTIPTRRGNANTQAVADFHTGRRI